MFGVFGNPFSDAMLSLQTLQSKLEMSRAEVNALKVENQMLRRDIEYLSREPDESKGDGGVNIFEICGSVGKKMHIRLYRESRKYVDLRNCRLYNERDIYFGSNLNHYRYNWKLGKAERVE